MRLIFSFLLLATLLRAAAEYPQSGPDIYDPTADGTAQIETALKQAKAENKRVLLKFGANWCSWCRALDGLMHTNTDVKAALARDYVVVLIDVNTRKGVKRNEAVNLKYGNPIQHGLPVLVVLDANDQPLVTQETGILEEGKGHDPAKVLAFLTKWAPPSR
ncbi:MAG TPA: thioredoxin family protein [Opitutaceae bacterium]